MIRTDGDGDVRTVTLDRPDRRNALTPDDLDALERAVTDADVPVVLLRGAGSAFCAGADLDAVADLAAAAADGDTGPAADFARHGQRVARAIEGAESVVIAGVAGPARGGGVELALACDLRVATPGATFGEPGVTFGLFGAWGGTHRLPRVVGEGVAADVALSGRVLDSEAALRTGLVSRVVDDPRAVAEELAGNDHAALARLKPLVRGTGSGNGSATGGAARIDEREAAEAEAFAALVAEHADALRRTD